MGGYAHLVRRFVGSLRPGGPSPIDVAWVHSVLTDGERSVWASMSGPDRRHSVVVARDVDRRLGGADRPVLAAALLHDSGKTISALRTPGRVAATMILRIDRPDAVELAQRAEGRGWRGRVARYALHPELGAQRLEAAGSDPLTVAWTREHHLTAAVCTIDHRIAAALRAADDD